jgi:hypothetical protein
MASLLSAPLKVLDAKAALNTVSDWIPTRLANKIVAWLEWGAGTSAGVVKLQGAPTNIYAGTPEDLHTFNWAAASTFDLETIEKTYPFVRLKITTAVVGGTVDGYIELAE